MTRTEYRIILDGVAYPQPEYPQKRWSEIALVATERRLDARLESRCVTDWEDSNIFLEGWLKLGELAVSPWNVISHLPVNELNVFMIG